MSKAMDNLGSHLLGRRPMAPDPRDYKLEDFLASHDKATAALTTATTLEEVHDSFPLTEWHEIYAFWKAFKALFASPAPAPTPTPPPAPQSVVEWAISFLSDQGQTPHCVGFTGLDWGNEDPVNDNWPNAEGDTIYYLCQPGDVGKPISQQQGSDSRTLCKVLQTLKRLDAYAFASTAETAFAYVQAHGPVGTGVPWDSSMFNVDADGYLQPNGHEEGGHEITLRGASSQGYGRVTDPSFLLQNHWGHWGVANSGYAYITVDAFQSLLDRGGDCWAGLELPVA